MKKFKYIAFVGLLLGLAACTGDAIDDLTGKYTAPADIAFTSVDNMGVEKVSASKRIFSVDFINSNGACLSMKFVGNDYQLQAGAYTPADASQAQKGNYITGAAGSSLSYNGTTNALTKGTVTVERSGKEYSISGTIWLADGSVAKVSGKGELTYEPDPEAIALTQVLSYANNTLSGTNSITLQLATDGVASHYDEATWTTYYMGTGFYLAVDFYSTDGSLAEGTYTPADSYSCGEFNYVKGYDPGDLWGIGWYFYNWGTCWWTVENGTTSAQHIEAGDITVTKKNGKYVITYNYDGLFFEFNGEISQLNGGETPEEPKEEEYVELTQVLSGQNNVQYGTPSITLNLATAEVVATYDMNIWSWVYSGNGNYLAIDLYSEDGTLQPGTYVPSTSGSADPGTFVPGYDPGDIYGWGIMFENWGTCWWTVEEGATSAQHIEDGQVTVTQEGNIYTLTLESSVAKVRYTGEIWVQ